MKWPALLSVSKRLPITISAACENYRSKPRDTFISYRGTMDHRPVRRSPESPESISDTEVGSTNPEPESPRCDALKIEIVLGDPLPLDSLNEDFSVY